MLFKTIHGSRLYGLAHKDSDYDFYTVVDRVPKKRAKYATHRIVDGVDSVVVDFGTWVNMCQSGVPQALEAMFSQMATFDDISEFRKSFVAGENIRDKYYRTIDNFLDAPDFKRNRHALRMAINLRDARRYGRFNPTLSPKARVWVTYYAKHVPLDELREFTLGFANDTVDKLG